MTREEKINAFWKAFALNTSCDGCAFRKPSDDRPGKYCWDFARSHYESLADDPPEAPPFPTVVWVRDNVANPWRGPRVSSGHLDPRGWIYTVAGGDPWKYWTTVEPEECRVARLGGNP